MNAICMFLNNILIKYLIYIYAYAYKKRQRMYYTSVINPYSRLIYSQVTYKKTTNNVYLNQRCNVILS